MPGDGALRRAELRGLVARIRSGDRDAKNDFVALVYPHFWGLVHGRHVGLVRLITARDTLYDPLDVEQIAWGYYAGCVDSWREERAAWSTWTEKVVGWGLSGLAEMIRPRVRALSLDAACGDDPGNRGEWLADPAPALDQRTAERIDLMRGLRTLSPVERKVMGCRFGADSQRQVAETLGLSQPQICRILGRIRRKIGVESG